VASFAGYTRPVRAIFLEVPESLLEERSRLGHDRKDELWEGVLHMVPSPSGLHETVAFELIFALKLVADRLALVVRGGTTALFAAENDYRKPDVVLARRDQMSDRGLEGAELAIEVLSPRDESRDKFAFYARVGVREVWLVDPSTRALELYMLVRGTYIRQLPGDDGQLQSAVTGLVLATVDGPRLRLRDGVSTTDV
jgi:Uma2 family endonuclease